MLIGLVWVFGPRKEDVFPEKYEKYIPNLPGEFCYCGVGVCGTVAALGFVQQEER